MPLKHRIPLISHCLQSTANLGYVAYHPSHSLPTLQKYLMHEAAVVYADQLSRKGLGYPLWIPEPHIPHAKLRVGDVGWFWEGSFFTLFNATLS
ncbi:hypothetical protein BDY19DRAFT_144774 [Irpex rosettiformis]|uniref:Uncharacterized protein n=1 Tax=Irpex rosettiformis TaxID=378272 RepID=A0ACB8U3F7_9APHY|nr:hypothetical protein BDY19DRAFT_144774 [Irpex rosettiformis]